MDIKIYVPCHEKSYVPKSRILTPIQVGAALSAERFADMLQDDQGENISQKNKMYCELTAQYWAWKNQSSDYVGFFHYRRYFNFSPISLNEDGWGNIEYREPLNGRILAELNIDDKKMEKLIPRYDVIVPKRRRLPGKETVQSQYAHETGQHLKDLKCVLEVLVEKYPEYRSSMDEYLRSREAYECNMFIMRHSIFEVYAQWLFDILLEAEKRMDVSRYSETELRALAYIGERLFGIWYTYQKKEQNWKTLELQRSLFRNTRPQEKLHLKKDEVGIVMSCNQAFCPVLSVALASMICHAQQERKYRVFIFHRDISEKNRTKICGMQTGTFSIEFVDIGEKLNGYDLHVDQHISVETYYRLLIPELFDCDKILYLDCDLVVNVDPARLFDYPLGSNDLAACRDMDVMGTIRCRKDVRRYMERVVGCLPGTYFQAGVVLLNLASIRSRFTTEELLEVAGRRKWKYWDQDILNYLMKGHVAYLPQKWNVLMNWENGADSRMQMIRMAPAQNYREYREARKTPYIVHYAGFQKPWKEAECDLAQYFWKYARKTPYYEVLIGHLAKAQAAACLQEASVPKSLSEIRVEGLEVPIAIDGVMLKIINRFNRRFPIGSKRRDRLRTLMRRIVR